MSNLSDFNVPVGTLPSTCERNSRILHEGSTNVIDYRKINVHNLNNYRKTLSCLEETCRPAFVSFEETIIEKIKAKWSNNGLTGIFSELHQSQEVHPAIRMFSKKVYNVLKIINMYKQKCLPERIDDSISTVNSIMACHPHVPKIAIVLKDNTIKIFNLNSISNTDQNILLKDKRIQKVTCLAWRPKSSMSLAAGSGKGILVWLLDPSITNARPGSNTSRYLCSKEILSDVSSITWCPDGKLLACSCINSASFLIWNVLSQSCTPIHRVGSNISFVKWSTCGQRLLTANQTGIFRVWETYTWGCEKWADLNGECTNACWSSCGTYVLFTVANESVIYYAHFQNNKDSESIDISGSGVALKCADVSKCMFYDDVEEIGGSISSMAWDPTNSRLAVTFKGESTSNQRYIALYHTRIAPFLQLVPCGFIRGEEDEYPLRIDFIHGYDKGALFTIYWSSESISLIPLLFNSSLSQSPKLSFRMHESGTVNFDGTVETISEENILRNETSIYSVMNDDR